MNADCLKLTVYFGERDRVRDGFLSDALSEIYARHQLQTSLIIRGAQGFGPAQHVHSDRLLTLSEDLPLVSVAVDTRERIQAMVEEVSELSFDGLVTLERARMLSDGILAAPRLPWEGEAATKLTVYLGRQERVAARPAYEAVVALLHARGVAGATVLLGVDGTAHGERQRAHFFGRNAAVPLMVIAVGETRRLAGLVPELGATLRQPLITFERVQICKRDGELLTEPRELAGSDPSGLGVWQKLMIYAGEQSRAGSHPLQHRLMRELLAARASGATSLRGIWGYHGDHPPHGDSFWQLRRRVPLVTVIVDTPARIQRWFGIVDAMTRETGLVTSETVPAYRASAAGAQQGGLRLARRHA